MNSGRIHSGYWLTYELTCAARVEMVHCVIYNVNSASRFTAGTGSLRSQPVLQLLKLLIMFYL